MAEKAPTGTVDRIDSEYFKGLVARGQPPQQELGGPLNRLLTPIPFLGDRLRDRQMQERAALPPNDPNEMWQQQLNDVLGEGHQLLRGNGGAKLATEIMKKMKSCGIDPADPNLPLAELTSEYLLRVRGIRPPPPQQLSELRRLGQEQATVEQRRQEVTHKQELKQIQEEEQAERKRQQEEVKRLQKEQADERKRQELADKQEQAEHKQELKQRVDQARVEFRQRKKAEEAQTEIEKTRIRQEAKTERERIRAQADERLRQAQLETQQLREELATARLQQAEPVAAGELFVPQSAPPITETEPAGPIAPEEPPPATTVEPVEVPPVTHPPETHITALPNIDLLQGIQRPSLFARVKSGLQNLFRGKPAQPPEAIDMATRPAEAEVAPPPPTTETAPITPPVPPAAAPPAAQSPKGWPTLPPADVRFEVRDEDVQVKQEPPLQQTETPKPPISGEGAAELPTLPTQLPEGVAKQPWEMTGEEANNLMPLRITSADEVTPFGLQNPEGYAAMDRAREWAEARRGKGMTVTRNEFYHHTAIDKALFEGKPVPPDVVAEFVSRGGVIPQSRIADYPDLQGPAAPPPAEAPTPTEQQRNDAADVILFLEQRAAELIAQNPDLTPEAARDQARRELEEEF